jgi:pentose-5-phosphate-3-epimerase
VSSAGANVFVAGSAIFYSENYAKTIRLMRERMDKASPLEKR